MRAFILPFFPPTTNHAYSVWHGRVHLAKEGKKFKTEVTSYLAQHYREDLLYFKKNVPYGMYLRLFFESLENAGWPKKCDTRYKVFDATNRVKLVEDACRDAFGIDDSQTVAFLTHKVAGPSHIELFVWNLEEEESLFDQFVRLRAETDGQL
jgi:Holliday junction resolvase RusA-like endonuclease